MAYATPAQLLSRKSSQTIGELVSESGTAVSESDLLTNTKVQAALESASGAIEAALLQGNRYQVSDLNGLTGNGQAYLVHLTCEIAMAYLFAIKPTWSPEDYEATLKMHDLYLERLRKGENVFNIDAVKEAGTPSVATPSVAEVQSLLLVRDQTRNYYPARRSQLG